MPGSGAYDAIVIGAGIGGLVCGTRLAQGGARVAICEAMPYAGGYLATYVRRGFRFPCGPLSFSSPDRVRAILAGLGLGSSIRFRRSHFRLLTPALDLLISQPFSSLAADLGWRFPHEEAGIVAFTAELRRIVAAMRGMEAWAPQLLAGQDRTRAEAELASRHPDYVACRRQYEGRSARDLAARFVSDPALLSLLSQQEDGVAPMPALLAANMWDILCETGIWYPDGGMQGVVDQLCRRFVELGGELRLGQPVEQIVCHHGQARGVRLSTGAELAAERVISNADYKRTLLEMVVGAALPPEFAERIRSAPVTGSDLAVSLGARLDERDLAGFQGAQAETVCHVLYRGRDQAPDGWDRGGMVPPLAPDADFFRRREIEICVWSLHDANLAPPGKASVVIRCRAPYQHFVQWQDKSRQARRPGYRTTKIELGRALIAAAEDLIPGLSGKAAVVDVATPLTFERYTGNHQGAVAGWSWSAAEALAPTPELMAQTPVRCLYAVGHWAFTMPFLGAVPTAMHSGELVAKAILSGAWS
jgi:phytoene dehydrogenase-like protein